MTAALCEPPTTTAERAGRGPSGPEGSGTFDSLLRDTWRTLAHGDVVCLVCGGRMHPRYGASGAAPVGGRCADCGSRLG